MLQIGDTVDGFHVVRPLHEGSMAVTYEVTRPPSEERLALKLMYLRDPQFQERLRRTAEAQRGFEHPHLVSVLDVVEIDGAPGVVSRFVDGLPLSRWIAMGPHPVAKVLEVARGIARGLAAAHERGLVHRNLKPQKILIDADETPHVHDFMLGKVLSTEAEKAVTQMGTTFGTPQYMAPEQFRGASSVDERADVFSMGCILFEMVTGRRAFDGTGVVEIYQQVASGDRPKVHDVRADCPEALEALVVDMLAPDPDDRIPSVRELVSRLDGDPELRLLVNPSFSTATPVSALTSDRSVKTAVTLEPGGPPKVVSVTPVDPPRSEQPDPDEGAVHKGIRGPELKSVADPDSPVADLLGSDPIAELSQDSRPSLITFTDHYADSEESQFPSMKLGPPKQPPSRPLASGGSSTHLSPALLAVGLFVLFLLAAGVGVLVASL